LLFIFLFNNAVENERPGDDKLAVLVVYAFYAMRLQPDVSEAAALRPMEMRMLQFDTNRAVRIATRLCKKNPQLLQAVGRMEDRIRAFYDRVYMKRPLRSLRIDKVEIVDRINSAKMAESEDEREREQDQDEGGEDSEENGDGEAE
jgi:hypothetical protein